MGLRLKERKDIINAAPHADSTIDQLGVQGPINWGKGDFAVYANRGPPAGSPLFVPIRL